MPVSKRARYEVLKRDNHSCRYCGATAPDVVLTVDHVLPVALGGSDDPTNLVAACRDCNYGKASTSPDDPLVENVRADALRWSAAMAVVVTARKNERTKRTRYVKRFQDAWNRWTYGRYDEHLPKPSDWRQTVQGFYNLGLPIEEVEEAVSIAGGSQKVSPDASFRYFCGVCYRKLDQIQQATLDLLSSEEVERGS